MEKGHASEEERLMVIGEGFYVLALSINADGKYNITESIKFYRYMNRIKFISLHRVTTCDSKMVSYAHSMISNRKIH